MKSILKSLLLLLTLSCPIFGQIVEQRFDNLIIKGPNPIVDIRAYGAKAVSGFDNDDAIEAAMAAAAVVNGWIFIPNGTWYVDGVTVPVGLRGIQGAGWGAILRQLNANTDVLTVRNHVGGLTVENLTIQGVAADADPSGNSGIDVNSTAGSPTIADSKDIIVRNVHFLNLQLDGVRTRFVDGLQVEGCFFDNVSHGINAHESGRVRITSNKWNASQLLTSLSVACSINTRTSSPTVHNLGVTIAHNTFFDRDGGQSILVHDGYGISITGNSIENGLMGIGVFPSSAEHIVEDVTITCNTIRLRPTSNSAAETGNSGIQVSGTAGHPLRKVIINGNEIYQANQCKSTSGQAAIMLDGYEDAIIVTGNIMTDLDGVGIRLGGNPHTALEIYGNFIKTVTNDAGGNNYGIYIRSGATGQGIIAQNYMESISVGVRCEAAYREFQFRSNKFKTVALPIQLAGGALSGLEFNVMDFGATGDGSTDDLDAILLAYSSLPTTGGVLYFPEGVYVIGTGNSGNGINILKNLVWLRFDRGAVLKKSGTGAAITIARAASTTVTGTKITGCKIISADTSTANTGISIAPDATNTAIDTIIEDVWIDAIGQYGIVAAGATGTVNRLHIRDVRITNNGATTGNHVRQPLILNPSTSSTELEISNVYCQQSNDGTGSTDGCKIQHFRGANISHLSITGGNVSTLVFDDMQDWTATNLIVRGTGGNGFQLESSATGRNVISNVLCVGTFASSNAVVLAAGGLEETSLINFDVRGQLMGATTGSHTKLRIKDSYFSAGIRLDSEATVTMSDSVIENCRIDGTAYIIGNNNSFVENYLRGAAGTAVVWEGDTGIIARNTIANPGAHGINVLDGDGNYISGNLIYGEGSNAINLTAGTGNLIGYNQFSGAFNDAATATTQVNTNIGGGSGIKKHLSATDTLNFGSIAGLALESDTITVTGAALGDTVAVGVPENADDHLILTAYVSASNTVKLVWYNSDIVTAHDPDSTGGTYRVDVWQH